MCGELDWFICEDDQKAHGMNDLIVCATDGAWICSTCYAEKHEAHDTIEEIDDSNWEPTEPLDVDDDGAAWDAEAFLAGYDDDPSPYDGTYSEM